MKKKRKFTKILTWFITFAMLFLLAVPGTVLAEGEEPTSGEPPPAEETDAVEEEAPAGEEAVSPEQPAADETTAEEPAAEPTAEEEGSEGSQPLGEVVEAMDAGDVVIVDGEGNAVPLASVEAAEVLLAPDPIGCPPGVTPTWMGGTGAGCTTNYISIQEAIDDVKVIDGWTVYVQSGTYNENVKLYKSISLIGQNKATTIIQPTSGPGVFIRADNTLIKNFTIDTSSWGLDFDGGSGYLPAVVTGGIENTTIENVDLTNNTLEGIFIGNGAQVDGLTVTKSKLNSNLNGIGISGGTTTADNIVIKNSEMNSNKNHGVMILGGAKVGSVIIRNSEMNENSKQGVMVQTGADVSLLRITNSDIFNNKGAGLAVNNAKVNKLQIYDTTLDGNNEHGLYLYKATIGSLKSSGSSYDNTTKWQGVHIESSNIGPAEFYSGSISGNKGMGFVTKTSTIKSLDIWNNDIFNNKQSGLLLTGKFDNFLWIDDNSFSGNGWEDIDLGYGAWAGGPITVNGETRIYGNNKFAGGAWNAIWVESSSSFAKTPMINYNWIDGPGWAIVNLGEIPLNAEYNYWGCDGGVGTSGCKKVGGAGWGASSNTDTDPWIMDPDADDIYSTNDGTDGWAWDVYIGLYDNCPATYNPDQLDSDGDGIGDMCDPTPYPPTPPGPGAGAGPGPGQFAGPGPLIPVTGGELVELSCAIANTLELPSGDAVILNQILCGYEASLDQELEETLPGEMPEGNTFTSGMTLVVLLDGDTVETISPNTLTVQFVIPAGMEGSDFAILAWDAETGSWVEVGGVTVSGGFVTVTVDYPGTFVLVTS